MITAYDFFPQKRDENVILNVKNWSLAFHR